MGGTVERPGRVFHEIGDERSADGSGAQALLVSVALGALGWRQYVGLALSASFSVTCFGE